MYYAKTYKKATSAGDSFLLTEKGFHDVLSRRYHRNKVLVVDDSEIDNRMVLFEMRD